MKWKFKSFNYHPKLHPVVAEALEREKENGSAYIRRCIEYREQSKSRELAMETIANSLVAALLKSGALVINSDPPVSPAIEDEIFDDLLSQF